MRDWLNTQNAPSFKGVPFEVDTDEVNSGRNIAVHEYPGSEDWDTEDVSRKPFRIAVEAYVKGNDVDDQAQALLASCTAPGSGLLTLPFRPQVTAECTDCTSTYVADAMGRITFHLEFVAVAGEQGGLVPSGQLANEVAGAADDGSTDVENDFSENYNSEFRSFSAPVVVPAVARNASAVTIGLAADALARVFDAVNVPDVDAGAQICFGIRQLRENAKTYAQQGGTPIRVDELVFVDTQDDTTSAFARIFAATLRRLARGAADPAILAAALLPVTKFEAQEISNSDLTALTVRAEIALINDVAAFVRRIAMIRWAHALTQVRYRSRADTVNAKGAIGPVFEPEIADAPNERVATALRRVRNSAAAFLVRNGAQLPRMLTIDLSRGLPAAVVAAMLYDDPTRDEELWRRNGIENHPLELPSVIEALAPGDNG